MENIDEAIARMQAEDELDAAREGLTKMTPIEFARAHGVQPQTVYYWIRTGKIEAEICVCGRRVIDIKSAEAYLESKVQAKKEISGSNLDAGE